MLKKSLLLGSTVVLSATIAAPAFAQVDEIIVTATKREQTLQEVPIAVTVTNGETIEQATILDIKTEQKSCADLSLHFLVKTRLLV